MRLTKNLSRHEFACQCGCGFDAADIMLVTLLQEACDHFKEEYGASKASITITSGNRCAVHNAGEGGAARSKHIFGIAADHRIKVVVDGEHVTIPAEDLAEYYHSRYSDSLGIGMYPNGRVHLDVREDSARWDNR
jgi:uncharacterized protein YcbK (DUF882 family)